MNTYSICCAFFSFIQSLLRRSRLFQNGPGKNKKKTMKKQMRETKSIRLKIYSRLACNSSSRLIFFAFINDKLIEGIHLFWLPSMWEWILVSFWNSAEKILIPRVNLNCEKLSHTQTLSTMATLQWINVLILFWKRKNGVWFSFCFKKNSRTRRWPQVE